MLSPLLQHDLYRTTGALMLTMTPLCEQLCPSVSSPTGPSAARSRGQRRLQDAPCSASASSSCKWRTEGDGTALHLIGQTGTHTPGPREPRTPTVYVGLSLTGRKTKAHVHMPHGPAVDARAVDTGETRQPQHETQHPPSSSNPHKRGVDGTYRTAFSERHLPLQQALH